MIGFRIECCCFSRRRSAVSQQRRCLRGDSERGRSEIARRIGIAAIAVRETIAIDVSAPARRVVDPDRAAAVGATEVVVGIGQYLCFVTYIFAM